MEAEHPSSPKLTVFTQKASSGTRYLVIRNLKSLLEHNYNETRFNNSNALKTKALQQLKNIVFIAENEIQPEIKELIYKLALLYSQQNQSPENRKLILQTAQLLGMGVNFEVVFLILLQILRPQMSEQKTSETSPKLATNLLLILTKIMSSQTENQLTTSRGKLFSVLKYFSNKFSQNDQGLFSLLGISQLILQFFREINDGDQTSILFNLLLNIQSTRSISQQIKQKAKEATNKLAFKCGFTSISELNAHQVGPILGNITKSKSYQNWTKTSKQRFQFDTLVRNCREVIPKFIDMILQIIQANINTKNDIGVRMDTLVLIQYILNIKQIHNELKQYSVYIMKNVLIPSIVWKIGTPETTIRKAGILNMITLITNQLIQSKGLLDCLGELFPPLKNCLTDDREPDLRSVSLKLIEELLLKVQEDINQDSLRDLYVSLLQRLDDSKNQLRIQATRCINAFLNCDKVKLIPTIFEYLLNGIFIHFDSECDQLRDKILVTLKHASKVFPKKVLQQAKTHHRKMKHTSLCQQLIQYCEQAMNEG